MAGSNIFGDITIENNVFDNIKADIILISRTMVGTEININYNSFFNYSIGAIRFDIFIEHVVVEREILKNYSDATISLTSNSEYISNTGRVIKFPEFTTEVEYTVTVEIDGQSKSITLVTIIPGINTWSQNYGFFKPTQPLAKEDYRN